MIHNNQNNFSPTGSSTIYPTSILKKRDASESKRSTNQSQHNIQSILKRHSVPDVDNNNSSEFISLSTGVGGGREGGEGGRSTLSSFTNSGHHSNGHYRRSSGDFHLLHSSNNQQFNQKNEQQQNQQNEQQSTCHFAIGSKFGPTIASPIIFSHSPDPHPILKNKSICGKNFTKEETRPKSILKKKTNSEDSSSINKVKPILKKNKSSEDFHHHNISSSSSSSSSSSLSNTSISSLPRSSLRRNSDSP